MQEDLRSRKDTRRGQEARAFDLHRTAVTADTENRGVLRQNTIHYPIRDRQTAASDQ